MELSKPSDKVLHEYLLIYGEEWVKETYKMSGDQIDAILYGAALPTQKQQDKKIAKARKQDEAKGAYLENYKNDHFLWDKPSKKHIRCQEADGKVLPKLSDEFMDAWTDMYNNLMSWDMKMNDNCMKAHGWSLGERVINKTTSLTTDDDVHEKMLRYLVNGDMKGFIYTKMTIKYNHKKNRTPTNKDEDFIDNVENMTVSSIGGYTGLEDGGDFDFA